MPIFLVLLLLPLSACSLANHRVAAAAVPQIVISTLQDPKTFNFALNQEFPNIFLFCYRGLVRQEGTTGEIQPDLAESWTVSDDRKQIIFTLRPDLKWSDGQPLTADDVLFTFQDIVFNEKIPAEKKDGLRIGANRAFPQLRKLDDRRIEFLLPEPFAPLFEAISGPPSNIVILPKHVLETSVNTLDATGNPLYTSTWGTDTDPKEIIVNGPYQIDRYRSGERLIFRRNPYYWERDAQGRQLPYIDRIVWQIVDSTDTQLLAFRSGDLDVIGDTRPLRSEYFSLLKKEEKRGKFQMLAGGPWSGQLFIQFNLTQAKNQNGKPFVDPIKSSWFNKLEFRQAVAYGLDRERMVNNVMRGLGRLQNTPISIQSPFYLKPEEGLRVYSYDPAKAKQLLTAAGFKYDNTGQLFDDAGNRVRFTLSTNAGNKMREALGAQIRSDLGKIGIQVDFVPLAFNTLISKLDNTRDWDCIMIGFTGGVDPHSAANLWLSTGGSHMFNLGPQAGGEPIQGWQPTAWEQEIDRLFQAGAQELDPVKRRAIYGEFQKLVQEQLPLIHLVHEEALMAVRDRLQGVKYNGLPSWGLWNIQEISLKDES